MSNVTAQLGNVMGAHPDITAQLARHDAAIGALGGRIHGVETGLRTLQGEVHQGFNALNQTLIGVNSKIDKLDSAPKFDFHKVVGTVVSLAILFGMVCGGIIYITTGQTGAQFAKQDIVNEKAQERIAEQGRLIKEIGERIDWMPSLSPPEKRR